MTTTTNGATVEHSIGLRGRFTLRLPSGDVVVRAVDGETARVRDREGHPLGDRFTIETGDGSLSLRAPENTLGFLDIGFRRKGGHADLEVELPRFASIQLETASADVRVDGLKGEGRYRTASGELTFAAVGGSIDIEAVSGDVDVRADAEMSIGCRTVSGEVTVEAPRLTRLQVTTTSGDIRATGQLAGNGPFSLGTVSGDAEITTSSGLEVEAKTVTGDIATPERHGRDRIPGRRSFRIGNGRTPLAFKSISGDLTIRPHGSKGTPDVDLPEVELPDVPLAPVSPAAPAAVEIDPMAEQRLADQRLEILRALERGEISVEEATLRLESADIEEER